MGWFVSICSTIVTWLDYDWRGLRLTWCLLPAFAVLFFATVLFSTRGPIAAPTHVDRRTVQRCSFHRVAGWPCPLCGFMRGAAAFLKGELFAAWAFHPVAGATCLSVGVAAVIGIWSARRVPESPPAVLVRALWLLAFLQPVLFAANWLWRLQE